MKRISFALAVAAFSSSGLARAATRVSSDSNCPSADAISQRLLGLSAAGGPPSAAARVRADGAQLRIELATPGEADQERTVAANGDCDARAETAALVIASWLDALPVGTISTPGIPPRTPLPVAEPAAKDERLEDGERELRLMIGTRTLVGAGLFGLVDSEGANAGVTLVAGMPALLGALGWAAEASLGWPRQLRVGQGTAHYWRPTFMLAATGEIPFGNWRLRPQGGPALGVLSVRGTDYEQNGGATTVTWGVSAGMALARGWGRKEIWLRLDGVMWPQGRVVRSAQSSGGPDFERALPEWEARLTAGMSFAIH